MYKLEQIKLKRRRGVVLTSTGIERLKSAILAVEIAENKGNHLSLEELSDRIHISSRTLSKLWSLSGSVDQKTVKLCFSAFNLELHSEDYTIVNEANETATAEFLCVGSNTEEDSSQLSEFTSFVEQHREQTQQIENLWSYPDGPVPLDSDFYTDRGCDRQWWDLSKSFTACSRTHASRWNRKFWGK